MRLVRCTVASTLLLTMGFTARVYALAPPVVDPDITFTPGDTALTGDIITFSVGATSAGTLTFTWNFGDGTANVVTSINTTTHVYTVAGFYQATVSVSDSVNPPVMASSFGVDVDMSPPATDPNGVDAGLELINPDTGLGVNINLDKDAVIQLIVDTGSLTTPVVAAATRAIGDRAAAVAEIDTDWGDLSGRTAVGSPCSHRYVGSQISVATVSAKDSTGSEIAKFRKTLAISARDAGELQPLTEPSSHSITVKSLKGKVNFTNTTKNDIVQVQWTVELPAGFTIDAMDLPISVGNISDTVSIDAKGKGTPTMFYKKVQIKYPKLPKGQDTTSAGMTATFTVELSAANLTGQGLDTEGITTFKKTTNPKIQVATLVSGVAYSAAAPVQLKLTSKNTAGAFARSSQ